MVVFCLGFFCLCYLFNFVSVTKIEWNQQPVLLKAMTKTSSATELTFLFECFAIHEFLVGQGGRDRQWQETGQARNRLYKAIFYNDFVVCGKASRLLLWELKMVPKLSAQVDLIHVQTAGLSITGIPLGMQQECKHTLRENLPTLSWQR